MVISCTAVSDSSASRSKTLKGFTLLFSGNWAGNLEPCGCTQKQLGGIDRRTQTIKTIAPHAQAGLLLDAGPLVEQQDRQSQLKFETFLYSLKQLDYDAICLTPQEIILLQETLALDTDQRACIK